MSVGGSYGWYRLFWARAVALARLRLSSSINTCIVADPSGNVSPEVLRGEAPLVIAPTATAAPLAFAGYAVTCNCVLTACAAVFWDLGQPCSLLVQTPQP